LILLIFQQFSGFYLRRNRRRRGPDGKMWRHYYVYFYSFWLWTRQNESRHVSCGSAVVPTDLCILHRWTLYVLSNAWLLRDETLTSTEYFIYFMVS